MSSAYLASSRAPAHHQPDLVRVAALSAAMAVNLTVFLAALRPLPPTAMQRTASAPLAVRWVDPPRVAPAPPPLAVKPLPHAAPAPAVAPPRAATPRASNEGNTALPPVQTPTIAPAVADAVPVQATGEPIEASLAYRDAPLAFPALAIRQHMHGTVLLRVLVDETGRPLEVVVEQSSGYTLLDRSAREQVLARWRFQPASAGGHAVRAWARVPVSFALRRE